MGRPAVFLLLAYGTLHAYAFAFPAITQLGDLLRFEQVRLQDQPLSQGSLENWIANEEEIALEKLLANISPGGSNVGSEAANGTVIASPSREHPNYYYQWIRDAAITTSTLVSVYTANSSAITGIPTIIDAYTSLSHQLQRTSNPSGTFPSLSTLGEPKFQTTGRPFTHPWGRPQHDGPALRALTLISYIRAYNRTNPELWNSPGGRKWYDKFYKATLPWNGAGVIKADLEYVARYWNDKEGFDLWEEVKGRHFFTAMVQYRALREGVQVARVFGDGGAADWYDEQSKGLSRLVERFFDENRGYVLASLDVSDRSGLDCAVLLGSIHGLPVRTEEQGEVEEGEESLFPPHSDAILNTLLYFMHDQRIRFPINNKPPPMSPLAGVALGRYPEDTYNGYDSDPDNGGGNPWFLCTSTAAELMYRTHSHICSSANLTISALGWPFYSSLLSTSGMMPEIGATYGRDNELVRAVLAALKALGDEFLGVVKRHTGGDGSMSEQINRNTGFEQGARDLTWSSGAFLKAVWARNKNGPQHI